MTQRILLVQLADIGDLILATPAMAALRSARPDAHISLLCSSHAAPILDDSLVDEIITLDRQHMNGSLSMLRPSTLRRIWSLGDPGYDTVVFFHHFTLRLGAFKFAFIARAAGSAYVVGLDNGNGWFLTHAVPDEGFGAKHQAQYWLDLVALLGADDNPHRAQVAFDTGVLPIGVNRGRRIIIHPGSGGYSLARRWNPEGFAQVADALHEAYAAQIVLVGGPDDQTQRVVDAMKHSPIDLSGKTSLTQLADLIRSADLYLGADSGVMHLAAAVRTPVLALFGPSNPDAWAPWSPGGQVHVLRSGVACSPCSYVGHPIGAREGCAARTCMRLISPEDVVQAASAILDEHPLPDKPRLVPAPAFADRIQILGIPVDRITYKQWLALIDQWVKGGTRAHHVCTTNPEFMMIAQQDPIFANTLRRAALCLPDGVGLLWAAKAIGKSLPERVTGSDGTVRIAERAAKLGWKIFLLGAAPGIADKAAEVLVERYPNLQIAGIHAGSPRPDEEDEIVQMVNWSGADILLVAYGAPEQDKWIARNLNRLHVSMAMGIGGSLDFIAGVVPRAPEWMQQLGLEWLYRLIQQPWRIRRMMRLPRFVIAVMLRGEK